MGLMDRVKSQASSLAEKAQGGARVGQERLMQMQGKRQSDALLLELGGLTYLARTGGPRSGPTVASLRSPLNWRRSKRTMARVVVTPAVPPAGESGSYLPDRSEPASPGSPAAAHRADPPPEAPDAQAPGAMPPSATVGGIPVASYASDPGSDQDLTST